MLKKSITAVVSCILVLSLVGCSGEEKKVEETKEAPKVEQKVDDFPLSGYWTQQFTKDEMAEANKEILSRMEELNAFYGLEFEKKEEVKEEKGETVNANYIYFDNLNPEPNRMESMYSGLKLYGKGMEEGQLVMKIGFNLNKRLIKEQGEFKFGETSIAKYSEAFTNVNTRDYSELDKQIYDIITGESKESKIENNLDGMHETITITEDYILYTLETKRMQFKK